MPTSFTHRKLEIIEQAANGHTSREIAEHLYVSPRTVDNHLHTIYRRLDISGREQLARLIADAAPSHSDACNPA